MALQHEDVLRDLELAIEGNDVTGVAKWFEAHPYAKANMDTESRFQDLRKATRKLLKETGLGENSDIFDVLLDNIYDPDDALNMEEEPLLIFMLREGTISCLEKLINRGNEVNSVRHSLWTPLILLINKPFQIDKTQYLVTRGADINKIGPGVLYGPLHYAVSIDDELEIVPTLIRLGADVNKPSRHTNLTPLHLALECGNSNIVDYLLDNGANPRIMSCEGQTAVDQSIQYPPALIVFLRKNIFTEEEGYCLLLKALNDWNNIDLMSLKLLLQTGRKCSRDEWAMIRDSVPVYQELATKLSEVEDLLELYAFNTRTLLDLSCFRVREILSTDLFRLMEHLPIPDFMKRYVKLEHYLGSISTFCHR